MLESSETGVRIRFYPRPASTWGCVYENRLPPPFLFKNKSYLDGIKCKRAT